MKLPITPNYPVNYDTGLVIEDATPIRMPNKTWAMQLDGTRCLGVKENVDAVIQAIHCILNTEQGAHIIYPEWYGLKLSDVYGKPAPYAYAILCDRIKDALLTDDRIIDVNDFSFEVAGDSMRISYSVRVDFAEGEIKGALYV